MNFVQSFSHPASLTTSLTSCVALTMSSSLFAHPLGPFNPIRDYILTHAQPLTTTNWPYFLLLPIAPLGVQAYLLQFENTRKWRVAIAVGALGLMGKTYSSYRFAGECIRNLALPCRVSEGGTVWQRPRLTGHAESYYGAFNAGVTIAYLHVLGKYVQFALPRYPIIDPYIAEGRSRIRAAVDLAFNTRMLGLGPTQIGGGRVVNSKDVGATASNVGLDGEVKLAGQPTTRANRARWLPYVNCGRTRLQATFRHAWRAYFHYVILDVLRNLIQHFGATTIGSPTGGTNVVQSFLADNKFVFLPRLYRVPVPDWVVESAAVWCMSGGLWHGLSLVYHFGALVTVGSGLWEPESWEADLFDAPWKADSVMQLWGNRWHQVSGRGAWSIGAH